MNIFYLSHDIHECAKQHLDKHCIKMILEYAQLLSTAHRVLDGNPVGVLSKTNRKQTRYVLSDDRESILYSATHINHPSAIWVRQSDSNYRWLATLLDELCKEYTHRYGKVHKVERDGLSKTLLTNRPMNIPQVEFVEPTPAMPDEYKVKGSSIDSYRKYYLNAKSHMFAWTKRSVPEWIEYANL